MQKQKHLIGNRYRVKDLIGEGGMASVYAAVDEKLNRQVAIKILHQHLGRNADLRERFLLEARTLSTFDHPNIIKVFDFSGLDSEELWMVTEILHGVDVAEYVKRFSKLRLHPVVASLIVREVCKALQEVHKLKIVHRDIKPENIMLLDNGHIRLMDFGIAKVNRDNATQTGTFMGSPSYMSPEQIRGAVVDARSDIYSLSVLYYEILTGILPYLGDTTAEVINKIMIGHYTPPDVHLPDIPAPIHAIITRGMLSSPAQRFQSMQEMMESIDAFLATLGFGDSRAELEVYMGQRDLFNEKLAAADIQRKTLSYAQTRLSEGHLDQTLHLPRGLSERPAHTTYTRDSQDEFFKEPAAKDPLPPASEKASTAPQPTLRLEPPELKPAEVAASRQRFRRSSPKIFIREHRADSPTRPRSSSSTFVLMGLIAAIALILVFGGERIFNRLERDAQKISQQVEFSTKKKRETPSVAPPSLPTPAPLTGSNTPIDKPLVVESQTVIIDGSKNPPRVSKREVSTPRSSRPLVPNSKSTLPASSASRRESLAVTKPRPAPDRSPEVVRASSSDKANGGSDSIPYDAGAGSEKGILKIASLPASEVFVDGKGAGSTNDKDLYQQGLKLDAGSYVVKFKRKGYKTEEYAVQVRPGETKQLNVSLSKQVELVEFTVRANKLPARLTIEDTRDGGRRRDFTLNRTTMVLNLRPGTYRVAVSHGSDSINRMIELNESEKAMTFNADFK